MRRSLNLPAVVATRFNPDLKAKYDHLVASGKCKKLAITAIMRKLLVMANSLLRDRRKCTKVRAGPIRIVMDCRANHCRAAGDRTIKEAAVKRCHSDSHEQLRRHLDLFIDAYNCARRLKTLNGLTSTQFI